MRVLILCTHNSVRSQLAEAIFRHFGKDNLKVESAGSNPSGVNPYVFKVLDEVGIDSSGLYSKSVKEFINDEFDYVITVCDNMKQSCPVFYGKYKKIHFSIQDPAEITGTEKEVVSAFRVTRNIIKALAMDFLNIPHDRGKLKCPYCGSIQEAEISEGKCAVFFKCKDCGKIINTPAGNCCVICGYSDKVCPEFLREVKMKYGGNDENNNFSR